MKKISIITLIASIFVSTFAVANEVNVFNARHYKADAEIGRAHVRTPVTS